MDSKSDCIFCKIVSGEILSHKIAEDENCIAVLDAFPVTRGHSLVITKRHCKDIHEMNPEEMDSSMRLLVKVANAVSKATDCPGVNLMNNTGAIAGQVIFHAHFHVIPRYEDDGIQISFNKSPKMTEEEKTELLNRMKNE